VKITPSSRSSAMARLAVDLATPVSWTMSLSLHSPDATAVPAAPSAGTEITASRRSPEVTDKSPCVRSATTGKPMLEIKHQL